MSEKHQNARADGLTQEIAGLRQQLAQLREYLSKQVELNRRLANAFAKSAETIAQLNDAQQRLATQQDLFYVIVAAKLFASPRELGDLLTAIADNPETPKSFADAASGLSAALARGTADKEKPRWIPEIVAGTDLDKP